MPSLLEALQGMPAMEQPQPRLMGRDGNQWFVLHGADLGSGVGGFGDTPQLAFADFHKRWSSGERPTRFDANGWPINSPFVRRSKFIATKT